jgi:hypothetical protein
LDGRNHLGDKQWLAERRAGTEKAEHNDHAQNLFVLEKVRDELRERRLGAG